MDTIPSIAPKEELVCDEALITGNVEKDSIIDAHKLTIKGTTCENSTQFSKYASIHTHKGTLRCHKAHITLLNEGEVHATKVHVDTAIGGSIYAQDVSIKHLTGDVTIYASHSITIEHISGKNNKLFINYREIPILMSKLDLIQDDIDELKVSLNKAKEDNSSLQKEIEVEIKRLENEISSTHNSTRNATITIEKPLKTKNSICFQLNDVDVISYETQEYDYSVFHLSFNKDEVTLIPTSQTITLNS